MSAWEMKKSGFAEEKMKTFEGTFGVGPSREVRRV